MVSTVHHNTSRQIPSPPEPKICRTLRYHFTAPLASNLQDERGGKREKIKGGRKRGGSLETDKACDTQEEERINAVQQTSDRNDMLEKRI